jgi:hypothetical protein
MPHLIQGWTEYRPDSPRKPGPIQPEDVRIGDLVEGRIRASHGGRDYEAKVTGVVHSDPSMIGLAPQVAWITLDQFEVIVLLERPVPDEARPWIDRALFDACDRADDELHGLLKANRISEGEYYAILKAIDPSWES